MDFLKKLANKGKIKYGALLAGFLALIIVSVIIFNTIISILGERYNWFFDMTDEQFYSASDSFVNAMEKVNENAELEIIFLDEKDTVSNDQGSVKNLVGLSYVHQTATDLAKKLDNIKVLYRSLDNTEFIKEFGGRGTLENDYVIIRRKSADNSSRFEVYTPESFYVFNNSELFAYNGESTLLEAAVRLSTNDMPTVYFTDGHGETGASLMLSFKNAGFNLMAIKLDEAIYTCTCGKEYSPTYDVKTDSNPNGIFLPEDKRDPTGNEDRIYARSFVCSSCGASKLEILESELKVRDKVPTNAHSVIINEPKIDFSENEIILLRNYLSKDGSVMAFLDNETDVNLPNLYGWFSVWGINVSHSHGYVSINQGNREIKSELSSSDAVGEFFKEIQSQGLKPVFENAVPLSINQTFDKSNPNYIETGYNCSRVATSLAHAPRNAFYNGASVDKSESNRSLLAITKSESWLANEDHPTQGESIFNSYLVVASGGFSDQLLSELNINTNSRMLRSLLPTLTSIEIHAIDIEFKVFNNYALDITPTQATTFMILSVVVLPLIACGVGFVVIFRRKRR